MKARDIVQRGPSSADTRRAGQKPGAGRPKWFLNNIGVGLLSVALCLLSIPPTLPMVQALGQLVLLGIGVYAVWANRNWHILGRALAIGAALTIGAVLHFGSRLSELETLGTVIRRFCLLPVIAMIVGGWLASARWCFAEVAFFLVGSFNAVVAYLSFTRIEKVYSFDAASWIGGGERVTLNYLDHVSVVYATALVLGTSPLVVGGFLLASRLMGVATTGAMRAARFIGWLVVAWAFSLFIGLSVYMGTRGAIVVTLLAGGTAFLVLFRKNLLAALGVPASILVVSTLGFIWAQSATQIDTDRILARFTLSELKDSSGTGRTQIWADAIARISDEPLGYGFDNGLDLGGFSSHNTFLDLCMRIGVPFGGVCLAVAAYAAYLIVRLLRGPSGQTYLGFSFSIVFYLIYAQFEALASASYHSWVIAFICLGAIIYQYDCVEKPAPVTGISPSRGGPL